jgi:hypothetical protein
VFGFVHCTMILCLSIFRHNYDMCLILSHFTIVSENTVCMFWRCAIQAEKHVQLAEKLRTKGFKVSGFGHWNLDKLYKVQK